MVLFFVFVVAAESIVIGSLAYATVKYFELDLANQLLLLLLGAMQIMFLWFGKFAIEQSW